MPEGAKGITPLEKALEQIEEAETRANTRSADINEALPDDDDKLAALDPFADAITHTIRDPKDEEDPTLDVFEQMMKNNG